MTEPLKPCPFCGNSDSNDLAIEADHFLIGNQLWYTVLCPCGAAGPGATDIDKAAAAWNNRAATPVNADLLAACKAAEEYDAAIYRHASQGKSWVQSDELDRLYDEWITKARAAIAKAEEAAQ